MSSRIVALAVAALAVGVSGCERADEQAAETNSTTLTVYASLPLQGPSGPESLEVSNGERLALRQAGGRAGDSTIKLVVLDDSTPAAQRWDARQTADAARTVVRDKTAIAYLGDGDSGATAISLPVLNAAGVLQVSPTSTYAGLTRPEEADKGEPEKYYPAGTQTFARTAPSDRFQATALVALLGRRGCGSVQVLDDRDVYGRGLATAIQRGAAAAGIDVVGRESLRPGVDAAKQAEGIAAHGGDCIVFGGTAAPWVADLFDALHRAAPRAELLGGTGLASDGFAASLDPGTQARTSLTTFAPIAPSAEGRRFVSAYRAAFGTTPAPAAAYGYEAMRLVLASIEAAGPKGGNRTAVARALFGLGERSGPLGRFRIDRHGDTSLTAYGEGALRDGRVVVRPEAAGPGA